SCDAGTDNSKNRGCVATPAVHLREARLQTESRGSHALLRPAEPPSASSQCTRRPIRSRGSRLSAAPLLRPVPARRRADAAAGKREPDHIGVLVRPEDRPPAEVLAFLLGCDLTLQGPIWVTQRDSAAFAGDQSGTTAVNDADFCFKDFLEFIWFAEMMALAGYVRSTA